MTPAAPLHPAGRSLLAVFAHPDDESLACGGLLAWCAALGARVSLLCLTRGEAGAARGSDGAPAALAAARTRELQAAGRTLGAAEVVLLDHADGMLPWIEAAQVEADIRRELRRVRPDVVVTFGDDGLYWHPDHVAVHERTTAAVASLGDEAPALYYVTMPPGSMRRVTCAPTVLGVAVDAFGAAAAPPTLVIDAAAFAGRKLAALRCHRSQVAGDPLDAVADADAARLLGTEHFRRAAVGRRGDTFLEGLSAPRSSGIDA